MTKTNNCEHTRKLKIFGELGNFKEISGFPKIAKQFFRILKIQRIFMIR